MALDGSGKALGPSFYAWRVYMARKVLMGALAAAIGVWVFNAVGSSLPRLNSRSGG